MTATFVQAQDDMLAIVHQVAEANGVQVAWEAVKDFAPPTSTPWVRPTLRHATGGQGSLTGGLGRRRWQRMGTLWLQVFTPLDGGGLVKAYQTAQLFINAFQGRSTEHCVWFRNQRITEVGPDGAFYHVNALIDFEYDEVV